MSFCSQLVDEGAEEVVGCVCVFVWDSVTGAVHPSCQTCAGCGRTLVVFFFLGVERQGEDGPTPRGGRREISAWHLTDL